MAIFFCMKFNSRSDIRLYPETQDVNSLGLLRFILSELDPNTRVEASLMSPYCGPLDGQCSKSKSNSEAPCKTSSSDTSLWSQRNGTNGEQERLSCIKSSRSSVSSQIELLLQKLQNGEEAMFSKADTPFTSMVSNTSYVNFIPFRFEFI